MLQRLAIAPSPDNAHTIDVARGNPIRLLFAEGYALQTTLLWIIFFCSLLDLFLFIFWLPEVLHLIGMTPSQAVFATSLYPLGGILAVLYLGWAIDRFGAHRSLTVHFAAGIVFISLIALVTMPYVALLAVVLLAGTTVLGSQTGLNGACGKLYPARMRVSGYGFATGIGRLGGIAAAPLGGYLLSLGLPPPAIFLSACAFAAVAAVATALLALPARPVRYAPGRRGNGVARPSVPAGVPCSWRQHIQPRAIRTDHGPVLDVEEHARMAERAIAAVAGDGTVVHLDGLGGHGQCGRLGHFASWGQFSIA